jgi:hypothetical protein
MVFSDFIQNGLSINIVTGDIYKVRRGDLSLLQADDYENIAFYGNDMNIKYQIDGDNYSDQHSYANERGYFLVHEIIKYVLDFYYEYFDNNPDQAQTMKNLYFEGFLHKDGIYYVYLFKKIERSIEFNQNIVKILKDCLGQIENDIIKDVEEYVDLGTELEEYETNNVKVI